MFFVKCLLFVNCSLAIRRCFFAHVFSYRNFRLYADTVCGTMLYSSHMFFMAVMWSEDHSHCQKRLKVLCSC